MTANTYINSCDNLVFKGNTYNDKKQTANYQLFLGGDNYNNCFFDNNTIYLNEKNGMVSPGTEVIFNIVSFCNNVCTRIGARSAIVINATDKTKLYSHFLVNGVVTTLS